MRADQLDKEKKISDRNIQIGGYINEANVEKPQSENQTEIQDDSHAFQSVVNDSTV